MTELAHNTSNLNVSELDFAEIRDDLKTYLKNQSELTDYDYDGSAMGVVLDLLAYTTHYNAFNANMSINESFIDTAQLRSSVVSHAKLLGYTPRSSYYPVANIDIQVTGLTNNTGHQIRNEDGDIVGYHPITLKAGSKFKSLLGNDSYTFTNTESRTVMPNASNEYVFDNVRIVEGSQKTVKYVYDRYSDEKYVLRHPNVVRESIVVKIYNSYADFATGIDYDVYTSADNLVSLNEQSKVYWIQESLDERYELYFGDGISGKALDNGSIVSVDYISTNNGDANGCRSFTFENTLRINDGSLNGIFHSIVKVSTNNTATGGVDKESIKSIKFNAPLSFASQNRAVTPDDYRAIVRANYGNVRALSVWGGEDNEPPQYGKVFICIAPNDKEKLTFTEKTKIINDYINPKNLVSIEAIIVDPTYTYISLTVDYKYNPTITNDDVYTISSKVRRAAEIYQDTELKTFDGVFRYSQFLKSVDEADNSIISSTVSVHLKKRIYPIFKKESAYTVEYASPLYKSFSPEPIVQSNAFNVQVLSEVDSDGNQTLIETEIYIKDYLGDDGVRRLQGYKGNNLVPSMSNIGYIDEDKGTVYITNLNVAGFSDKSKSYIEISASPRSNDISPLKSELLNILHTEATINGHVDTMATGGTSAGIGYTTIAKG